MDDIKALTLRQNLIITKYCSSFGLVRIFHSANDIVFYSVE